MAQSVNIQGNPYNGNPYPSIANAINASNDGDVILISGIHTGSITINKSITLRGSDPTIDIIQAAANASNSGTGSRVISVVRPNNQVLNVKIENLGIRHGNANASSNGGGIDADKIMGLLTLRNLIIENNFSARNGGALSFAGTNADVIGCTIQNNSATLDGGAIIAAPNNASMIDNVVNIKQTLINNNQGRNGGGIYINGNVGFGDNYKLNFNIENSTISNNAALSPSDGNGGGSIFVSSALWTGDNTSTNLSLQLIHATIYNNSHAAAIKSGIQFSGSGTTNFSAYNSIVVAANAVASRAINFANANTLNVLNCILGGLNAAPIALLDNVDRNNLRGRTATQAGLTGNLSNEGGNTSVLPLNSESTAVNYCTASTSVSIPIIDQRGFTKSGVYDAGAFEIDAQGPITWNGISWSNVDGPNATLDVIISGAYDSDLHGGSISAKNLTMTSTGSVHIKSGHTLNLDGSITNNGSVNNFIVDSGSYIMQNTNDYNVGHITIKRNTNIKRLDISLWSSCVAAQNLLALSPETLTNRFFNHDELNNNWVVVPNVASHRMAVGLGYGIRAPNNWTTSPTEFTAAFKGEPNNGDYTQPFTSDHPTANFNLLGNPYPSVLDLRAFLNENSTKIQNKFYFYEHTLTNAAVGQTNYGVLTIAPDDSSNNVFVPATNSIHENNEEIVELAESVEVGQGFFVRANTSDPNGFLQFNNSMRKSTPTVFFKNNLAENAEVSQYRLQLTNPEGYKNQTVVGYYPFSTDEEDLMDTAGIGSPFYSLLESKKLVSQGFGLPFNQDQVIHLGANFAIAGNYTIALIGKKGIFDNQQYILIHDSELNIYHNLSISPYSFETTANDNDARFTIVYSNVLSTQNPISNQKEIVVFVKGNDLVARANGNTKIESIEIYSLEGRVLFEENGLNHDYFTIDKIEKSNKILFVIIKTNEGLKQTHKVIF